MDIEDIFTENWSDIEKLSPKYENRKTIRHWKKRSVKSFAFDAFLCLYTSIKKGITFAVTPLNLFFKQALDELVCFARQERNDTKGEYLAPLFQT